MRRTLIYTSIVGAALVGFSCIWLVVDRLDRNRSRNVALAQIAHPAPLEAGRGDAEMMEPKLFAVCGYPPKTAEEKRLWDWWKRIEEVNPNWEWERPIEFYGAVQDNLGLPVANAKVSLEWAGIDATPRAEVRSDPRGRFQLTGVRGKGLTVSVQKAGYHATKSSRASFEYAAFWERNFHVPNPEEPVIFRLHMRGNPERLFVWTVAKDIKADGNALHFDVESGTFGGKGTLSFAVTRSKQKAPREFDFTVEIRVADGGGLAITRDELMFEAPLDSYVAGWRTEQSFGAPNYRQVQSVQFYLKTAKGTYAAVRAQIAQMADPQAQVQMTVFYNPSGSRNLEYDPDQRLNR
jgi:hypothetical protein